MDTTIIKTKIFLVVGLDYSKRKEVIDAIKTKLETKEKISLTSLYSEDINLEELKDQLLSNQLYEKKLIVIRNADKLKKEVREFILDNIEKILSDSYLVFELDKVVESLTREKNIISDKLFGFVLKYASIYKILASPKKELTHDDFRLNLRRKDFRAALVVVDKLLENKTKELELGPFLLGILISELSYTQDNSERQKYLSYLLKTDRLIKEKGFSPRLALELLLARLI